MENTVQKKKYLLQHFIQTRHEMVWESKNGLFLKIRVYIIAFFIIWPFFGQIARQTKGGIKSYMSLL